MGDSGMILIDAVTILPQSLFGSWVLCRLLPMRWPKRFISLYTGTILALHSLFLWVLLFPPAVKMAVMFLVMVLLVCLFSQRENRLAALGITLFYVVLLILAEFLTVFFLMLLLNAGPGQSMEEFLQLITPNLLVTRCAYTALCLLMLLPLYWGWRKLLRKDTVQSVPELLPFLLAQSAMLLMGELMLLLCGRLSAYLLPVVLAIAVLSCGALAAVLWAYRQEQRRHSLQLNNQSLALQSHALEMEQAAAADQETQVRSMQSDLSARLQEIGAALNQGAGPIAREQIVQTAKWLRLHAAQRYCENIVVNAVMTHQALRCRAANIRLDCMLELPKTLDAGEAELCSVFSNLMDNAVRACTALPEKDRQIELSATIRGAYLIVRERNPLPDAPIAIETRNHGLGLGILNEIARRYDGELEIIRKEGQFIATLWLRLGIANHTPENEQAASGGDSGLQAVCQENGLPLVALPLSQLVPLWFILFLWQRSGQPVHWGGPVLIVLLGVFADLLLLQLFRRLRDTQEMQKQALVLESELSARKRYLEQLDEASLQLRRIRHDMNNHFQTLGYLIGAGALDEAGRYVDELISTLPSKLAGEEEK